MGCSSSLLGGFFRPTKPAPRCQNLVWKQHPAPKLKSLFETKTPGLAHNVFSAVRLFLLENFQDFFLKMFLPPQCFVVFFLKKRKNKAKLRRCKILTVMAMLFVIQRGFLHTSFQSFRAESGRVRFNLEATGRGAGISLERAAAHPRSGESAEEEQRETKVRGRGVRLC